MTADPGTLADHVGGVDVLRVTVAGVQLDHDAVGPVKINHGRNDPTATPDPATATVQLRTSKLPALPQIGDQLRIELGADAIAWAGLVGREVDDARVRFVGRVSDVVAAPDRHSTGPASVTVIAVSRRAMLGRVKVGDTPWPVELDGARAGRILELAAAATGATVGYVDPGWANVTARDVDAQPPLDLLDTLALDTGGTLAERRDGALEWHDLYHRRRSRADVTLTADQVLAALTADQKLGGIVNELTVTYGPAVAGGERPTVTAADPVSADPATGNGPLTATLGSQLQDQVDAQRFAWLQIGRRSRPIWQLSGLTVELLRTVTPTVAGQLLRLEFGSLIAVEGFPTSGPFTAAYLWCEGWTESISRTSWRLDVTASDFGRNGPPPTWYDASGDTDTTWAAPLTWLDLYRHNFPPHPELHRWLDVPNRERWGNTPYGPTWASYPDTA